MIKEEPVSKYGGYKYCKFLEPVKFTNWNISTKSGQNTAVQSSR